MDHHRQLLNDVHPSPFSQIVLELGTLALWLWDECQPVQESAAPRIVGHLLLAGLDGHPGLQQSVG